jgi:hypothetical protein
MLDKNGSIKTQYTAWDVYFIQFGRANSLGLSQIWNFDFLGYRRPGNGRLPRTSEISTSDFDTLSRSHNFTSIPEKFTKIKKNHLYSPIKRNVGRIFETKR